MGRPAGVGGIFPLPTQPCGQPCQSNSRVPDHIADQLKKSRFWPILHKRAGETLPAVSGPSVWSLARRFGLWPVGLVSGPSVWSLAISLAT